MPNMLGYSFDDQTKAPQATQNPLANMASAASPGLTSPGMPSTFDKVFGDDANKAGGGGIYHDSPPHADPGGTGGQDQLGSLGAGDPWAKFQPGSGSSDLSALGSGGAGAPSMHQPPADPGGGTLKLAGGPSGSQKSGDFSDLTSQVHATADPQQKAVLRDQLARNVYGTLKDAGHDVKWDGDNLVVDGRPYVVAGGAPPAGPDGLPIAAGAGGQVFNPNGQGGAPSGDPGPGHFGDGHELGPPSFDPGHAGDPGSDQQLFNAGGGGPVGVTPDGRPLLLPRAGGPMASDPMAGPAAGGPLFDDSPGGSAFTPSQGSTPNPLPMSAGGPAAGSGGLGAAAGGISGGGYSGAEQDAGDVGRVEPGGVRGGSTATAGDLGYGDQLQAASIYDTSNMTPEQRAKMAADTAAKNARDQAGAQRDRDYLTSLNGAAPDPNYQWYKPEGADPSAGNYGGTLVGGSAYAQQSAPPAGSSANANYVSFPGFDGSKFGKDTKPGSKYTPAAASYSAALGAGVQFDRGNLDPLVQFAKANGFPNAKSVGDDKVDYGDGMGPIDVIQSNGTKVFQNTTGNPVWEAQYGSSSSGGANGGSGGGSDLQSMFDKVFGTGSHGAAGVDVNSHLAAGSGGTPAPPAPPPSDAGKLTGPTYTPGKFDNSDLNGLSMDEILGRMGDVPNPKDIDPNSLGQLGSGKTDPQTEALMSQLLQHPESMDPQTVEMLKAKSKDELADMAKSDDEDMQAMGYQTGNADSNWLASQRLARKGERDNALVSSNRNIDLTAAQTNQADRRAAAQLGQSYGDSVNQRNVTNHDANLRVAQQNIDNQFKSTEEKQQAVKLAADTQLAAAAQKGDRASLEQQFQQKAAELGQSADKIRQDYLLGLMDDATKRYGIDVGASVDRSKLSQAGTEFQQDMIFRIMQLRQQDQQFGASYGLQVSQQQEQANEFNQTQANGGL